MTLSAIGEGKLIERHEFFYVNDVRYLVEPLHEEKPIVKYTGAILATIIHVEEGRSVITADWIQQCIKHFEETDDVFQTKFLQGIVFCGGQNNSSISSDAEAFLQGFGMQWHLFWVAGSRNQPAPGPYLLLNGSLHEPFRLYNDKYAAFFSATRNFRNIDDSGDNYGQTEIAVPSRLRSNASSKLPMLGIRVAIKDNLDLEGTKTSLCSRSYLQTYPKKLKSAFCVQRLVDLGAVIVGKTKLCSFAQWEEPTEAIDYMSPWNPRADGYQSSGGSSNGSGAAISAYDWLDIAIGSDTTGSILRPALWNGCFSLRPSFGALSTEGFVSCIKYLDTPGIMSRDLQQCRIFAASWYGDSLHYAGSKFSSLLWPTDYWNRIDCKQRETAHKFVLELESTLGLQHMEISFNEKWQENPPEDVCDLSLNDYMIKASTTQSLKLCYLTFGKATQDMWYDDYHAFDDFREEYWAKHQRAPYISPPTRAAWNSCKSILKTDRDEAARRIDVFRSWFHRVFFNGSHPLFIMPIENVGPRYRDDPPEFQRPPTGVHTLLLASLVESPELAVPRTCAKPLPK